MRTGVIYMKYSLGHKEYVCIKHHDCVRVRNMTRRSKTIKLSREDFFRNRPRQRRM